MADGVRVRDDRLLHTGRDEPAVPAIDDAGIVLLAMLATMVGRCYTVGPPGGLFFIMAAAIGAYSPVALAQALMVGPFAMGCLLPVLVGFLTCR